MDGGKPFEFDADTMRRFLIAAATAGVNLACVDERIETLKERREKLIMEQASAWTSLNRLVEENVALIQEALTNDEA